MRVQQRHLVVVELPRVGDLRLGADQLLLQREEVLVRLEVGVALGDRDQPSEPRRDGVLGARLILHPRGAHRLRPRLGHLLEDLALVRRVPLHRLDQVGDQVVPAAELHVDLRPAVLDAVPERDEPVVREHGPEQQDHDHGDEDPDDEHRDLSYRAGGDRPPVDLLEPAAHARSSRTWRRARGPRPRTVPRAPGSSRIVPAAAATAAGSRGGTRNPSTPSVTTSS